MNVNSGGPHLLLFERDQQLMTLLSGELALAGYEVHTARTAVEVFDAIARFPVRLVMVNLAQAQAGRREFWVALDAQRRGRGVQVFTFRCANLAGYGPDDPEEHVETVLTDLEVDGMLGIVRLVDAVRERIPALTTSSTSTRVVQAPTLHMPEISQEQMMGRPGIVSASPSLAAPIYPSVPMQAVFPQSNVQPLQGTIRPQPPQDMSISASPVRPVEQPRSGLSTFTDKIRAVIYPSSRHVSSAPEANRPLYNSEPQAPNGMVYPPPEVQPHLQASQRFAEADYAPHINREEVIYQPPANTQISHQVYPPPYSPAPALVTRPPDMESSLDQLSRMLRENQPAPQNTLVNGHMQNGVPYPSLNLDPQEIQEFRAQILQAARLDEVYERSNMSQPRPISDPLGAAPQLRASPIQDIPFEREAEHRRTTSGPPPLPENYARPPMATLQPTQSIQPGQAQVYQPRPAQMSPAQTYQPQAGAQAYPAQAGQLSPAQTYQSQSASPVQASPVQAYQSQPSYVPSTDGRPFPAGSSSQVRPLSPMQEAPPETPISAELRSQVGLAQEASLQSEMLERREASDNDALLPEQIQAGLQSTLARRSGVKTSDDLLLDIVKSLPPMAPAPQPPQVQALNGRATRSLGSVLLEGHLVPQERLQVAQHVQRMLRGVDLNYQLGEILLMFKLLTPDQLLAASLVSYGMISTVQISALGRIRQELHAIGLEYDLESLVILFRILSPEQMREVRASWSS